MRFNSFVFILLGVGLLISLPPLLSACSEDNFFEVGEVIDICSSYCIYQNLSNSSYFHTCDNNITCSFSSDNFNLYNKNMSRKTIDGEVVFNYSIKTSVEGDVGIYKGFIKCRHLKKGYFEKEFDFEVYRKDNFYTTNSEIDENKVKNITQPILEEGLLRLKNNIVGYLILILVIMGLILIIAFKGKKGKHDREMKKIRDEWNNELKKSKQIKRGGEDEDYEEFIDY